MPAADEPGSAPSAGADQPARVAEQGSPGHPAAGALDAPHIPGSGARGSRWRRSDPHQWGLRPKLITLLLIPTLAALLLGGLRLQSALSASGSYSRVDSLASASRQVTALVHALQTERDLTAGVLAAGRRQPTAEGSGSPEVDGAAAALRASLRGLDSSHDEALHATIRTAIGGLDRLAAMRASATSARSQPDAVFRGYTSIIADLLPVIPWISAQAPDTRLANQVFALESLALVKESAAQQRAMLYAALTAGKLPQTTRADLAAARARQAAGGDGLLSRASPAQRQRFLSVVRSPDAARVETVLRAALSGRPPDRLGVGADQWFALMSRQIDRLVRVEASQGDEVQSRAHDLRSSAGSAARASALAMVLILAVAVLATWVVDRSMLRPLRALRSTALEVAQHRLPETVRRLQESEGYDGDAAVTGPVGVDSGDEITEVARAFDAVHHQAVRLASEQAVERSNVSAMFVNLSRRSQTLVERQLRLIDELETSEQDPDRLANLFKLDHLATRMRRNDENLLVLAGAQGGRRRTQPVPLLDVARAASAEVEQYARVHIDVQTGHEVTGRAVNDAVHLIAELLENATTFSPPHTPVRVRALGLGGSGEVVIEIEDEGIGMTAEELEKANDKLSEPAAINVSMSRMMGLFVVARLAQRQGIKVQLRPSSYGGVTALVRLPAAIVVQAGADPEPEPGAQLRLIPEPSPSPEREPTPAPRRRDDQADPLGIDTTGEPPGEPPGRPDAELERLPIFDALQSEWFRPPLSPELAEHLEPAGPSGPGTSPPARSWDSPGDEGWQAVAAMAGQPPGGVTSAGLPLRIPGRNLVPGSATPGTGRVPTHRTPHDARTLSSYQQGVGRARAAGAVPQRDRPDLAGPVSSEEQP